MVSMLYDVLKSGYTIGAAGAVVTLSIAAWIYESFTSK
jgi:hypothetical protein